MEESEDRKRATAILLAAQQDASLQMILEAGGSLYQTAFQMLLRGEGRFDVFGAALTAAKQDSPHAGKAMIATTRWAIWGYAALGFPADSDL